jgi:uncharacterized protein (TIGR01777 family)
VTRTPRAPGEVGWDPEAGRLDPRALDGVDAVVHLAGASVGERWTRAHKAEIRRSRALGTQLLAETLARMPRPPRALVSASAIGYYGDRGDEALTEDSKPGTGFLSELVQAWEAATAPAEKAGVRVVHLRSGIVLSPTGGALGKQVPLFRLGLGGQLGSGRQYVSWISLADEVGAILHAIRNDGIRGPLNATAPNPVTNNEYTRVLGATLGRPTILRLPTVALSVALGAEMARETALVSQRARRPTRLEATGYRFTHPDLAGALEAALRH